MTKKVYVPTEELAAMLAVKTSTLLKWVKFGKIPPHMYLRIGGTYRFCLAEILEEFSKHNDSPEIVPEVVPEAKVDVLSEPLPLDLHLTFNADDDL